MNAASRCGNRLNSPGTGYSAAPACSVPNTSNVDRSKCIGGCHETRSDGRVQKYAPAHRRNARTLSWVITTPLGTPVDPDVNKMCAAASGPFCRSGGATPYAWKSDRENCGRTPAAPGGSPDSQPTE